MIAASASAFCSAKRSTRIYCETCSQLWPTSATLTRLDLKEGSAGTVRYSMALAASGGGVRESFTPYWRLPPNIGLFGALSTGVTDVRVNVDYYIA